MAGSAEEEREVTRPNLVIATLGWPVLWGVAATFAFYATLPFLPAQREFALRYFCGHWIEYTTTGLFFLGMALLAKKALRLSQERQAITATEEAVAASSATSADRLLDSLPSSLRRTAIAERLRDTVDHLAIPQASHLSEHLKYLAELAAERLHGSYALVRTVCWAIPILGFLGTVMGITIAIANIDPEQLSGSLGEVTGGLAVAFDTTALALALSLVLVFATFAIERAEQSVLDHVEAFAMRRLAPLASVVPASPLAQAEVQAANELVERTDTLIRCQTEAWQGAIESMRRRWAETIVEQQGQLRETLTAGMGMTLADHAEGLKVARDGLVLAVTACTDRLDRTLAETNRERARQLEAFSSDLRGLWDTCRGDLDDLQERHRQSLADAVSTVGSDLRSWREELRESSAATISQRKELTRQSELLVRVTEQSAELVQIEDRLNGNLESLRATETLQEAVHSLTAAAHLLTARVTPRSRAA
ncbi:MAG: MotA/TolQ/ExbB proton channel family protein [Planctomycetota bacterium]|nr:MotA/TolQ/ExbB proton channel family protein [Planctomycetaceae bacterium]MDQ3329055.1 MotA/TolQ/ExbB proton channel family protein [Planctomycetota bacterium]